MSLSTSLNQNPLSFLSDLDKIMLDEINSKFRKKNEAKTVTLFGISAVTVTAASATYVYNRYPCNKLTLRTVD